MAAIWQLNSQKTVGHVELLRVEGKPAIGGYGLQFVFGIRVVPVANRENEVVCTNHAMTKISVSPTERRNQAVSLAIPPTVFNSQVWRYTGPELHQQTPVCLVMLSPMMMSAIESVRDEGDLHFAVRLESSGWLDAPTGLLAADVELEIPQSTWIKVLRDMRFQNTFLFELPVPDRNAPEGWKTAVDHFQSAQKLYLQRDLSDSAVKCRKAIEDMERLWRRDNEGASPTKGADKGQTLDERVHALWSAARHVANLSPHSNDELSAATQWRREDAELLLRLVGALLAHEAARAAR